MVRTLLALFLLPALIHAQGTSWGDQGNGTFLNPILQGDYPDVDIEQLGDTYYLITSTNHYAPGMTIAESKDMVNWTLIGHVYDKLDWNPAYGPDAMGEYSKGVWAGALAYHEGAWRVYMIDNSFGLYVTTAKDIRGPWTKPKLMLAKSRWTDPAVYWDEQQHQAYLVANFGTVEGGKPGNHIRMFKMSWDGMELEDEGQDIYVGPGAEAAKIYKIDGRFHIFLVEWIENDRLQLDLRGPAIYGPFERKVLMERRDDMDRSTCQGALLEAPDGSWWLTHQAVQHRAIGPDGRPGRTTPKSYEGRGQWLVPVAWQDGWPVVGADPDGDGVNETVDGARKPVEGFPITAPQADDDFDSPALGPQWEWNHNPRDENWSLAARPGWLRLEASVPVNDGGFWNAANTLSQRIMGTGKGLATARIDVSGMAPGQQAGFSHHSGKYVLLGLKADDGGVRRLVWNEDGREIVGPAVEADVVYFRTDVYGDRATFSWRPEGEPGWRRFGPSFQLIFGNWRGDRIGFYCWNDKAARGRIDVDWFRYRYDGPLGAFR